MYLYIMNNDKSPKKSISIYSFTPDKMKLIEYKKKYLNCIKSVILHVNNEDTKKILFTSPRIMFSALDRQEDNGKITYIEETNNDEVISQYINGKFDSLDPVSVIGSLGTFKSLYCGDLPNQDCTLLFSGGHPSKEDYVTEEGVLLTGILDIWQPLLSNDINNLLYPYLLEDLDEDVIEFLKIFNCTKLRVVSLEDLTFLQMNGVINISNDFYDMIGKSEIVLDSYNMIRKIIKNK